MYFASPNSGERFYLRLLLLNIRGPRSWRHLLTVDNVVHDTYKATFVVRGLFEDGQEWVQCLQEAAIMKTGYQLRRLFAIILTQCFPVNPDELWARFSMNICDDLAHKMHASFGITNPTDDDVADYGLHLLEDLLRESGKSLTDFLPMPQPVKDWSVTTTNRLIWKHRQLQYDGQESDAQINVDRLNEEQRNAYIAVTSSVNEDKGIVFFFNGGAGTRKTFLYNTIAAKCRSLGHIVIFVASSGIASLLLVGGRTAHSTFFIPLNVFPTTICSFTKQSIQAELFREAKLIIWDEVPMQHRHCVETVDRTLQDIRDNNQLFGGLTVLYWVETFVKPCLLLGNDFVNTLWEHHYKAHIFGSTYIF